MNSPDQATRRNLLKLLAGAPLLPLSSAMAGACLTGCGGSDVSFTSVAFKGMDAPTLANPAAMASTTAGSTMTVTFSDASTLDFKLAYQPFFITGDSVPDGKGGTVLAGGYWDINNQPIIDATVPGSER